MVVPRFIDHSGLPQPAGIEAGVPNGENDTLEPMRRVALTITLDQGLLEVEAKSATNGRLYNVYLRNVRAVRLLTAIAELLAAGIPARTASLGVDRESFLILPDQ